MLSLMRVIEIITGILPARHQITLYATSAQLGNFPHFKDLGVTLADYVWLQRPLLLPIADESSDVCRQSPNQTHVRSSPGVI